MMLAPLDLPSQADRRRLRDARARARIAVEEAGRRHQAEVDAVFREEIGSTVRSVSPFLASLMAAEGYSLDDVVKGIKPAQGWPHRPRLTSGGLDDDPSRHLIRYYAASLLSRQGKMSLPDPAHDVWMPLSDGGWARVHIAGHSIEVDARIGAIRLVTRFGELRVEVPQSPETPGVSISGRRIADIVRHPALKGRDWRVAAVEPASPPSGGSILVVVTGATTYRLPWARWTEQRR
jgi:hypothetical protein